jgi:hypothetical protein
VNAFRLGLRLALKADRVRLVVTASAVALAVAFLLGALGALPAREAKLQRLEARNYTSGVIAARPGTSVAQPVEPAAPDASLTRPVVAPGGVRLAYLRTQWRGHEVEGRQVIVGNGTPLAPGLSRYPRPGELIVSPALAAVLRGPHAAELAHRLPGKVVGTIGKAGLAGPDELYAYVGAATATEDFFPVSSFGADLKRITTPVQLRLAADLGALGLLLPVLVLVATGTRLSAASRDRRFSALRLVGASPRQATLLAAADGLVAGGIGVVLGLVAFVLLRPLACSLLPYPEGVFASDLLPPTSLVLAVVLGVPLLAVVTGLLALRRVVTSPLGVRRQARTGNAGWWRLAPVLVGLGLLLLMRHQAQGPVRHISGPLLLTGGGLTLVGLAVAAPAVSRLSARVLIRVPGLGTTLAARRVDADPGASARVVTGMVLVVFVTGWLLAFLPVLKLNDAGYDRQYATPKGTLIATAYREKVDTAALRAVPGVRRVLPVRSVTVTPPGWVPPANDGVPRGPQETSLTATSCADLVAFLKLKDTCGDGAFHRLRYAPQAQDASYADPAYETPVGVALAVRDEHHMVVGTVKVPADAAYLDLPRTPLTNAISTDNVLIEESALPAAALGMGFTRLIVTTDGTENAIEGARAALPQQAAYTAYTYEEQVGRAGAVYLGYLRAVRIGLVLALLIGAASLAVSTADAVHERRRSLAALVAIGTPVRLLRRAVLLQMAAPMLGNVVAALGAAAVASWCYLEAYDEPLGLPWGSWSLAALGAVGAVVLATTATLPLLRAIARPAALRTE